MLQFGNGSLDIYNEIPESAMVRRIATTNPQPKSPETQTDRTIPFDTLTADSWRIPSRFRQEPAKVLLSHKLLIGPPDTTAGSRPP